HIVISPYNKRANGVVERGHLDIRNSIIKSCEGNLQLWPSKVAHAFFADKTIAKRGTGYSPFWLLHGVEPVLPFDLAEATFMVEGFRSGMSTSELLALRIRQLEKRPTDIARAAEALKKSRFKAKERWERENAGRFLPDRAIRPGIFVLVRNTASENSMNRKDQQKYLGPYEVVRMTRGGSWKLKEMDGTPLKRGVAAFRLIPYILRTGSIKRNQDIDIDFDTWELDDISDDEYYPIDEFKK
uniref:hypothetical protein n=1 Tax=Aetokthonos hydrillicola TaxID=1550245 RepID=UPI001ABA6527